MTDLLAGSGDDLCPHGWDYPGSQVCVVCREVENIGFTTIRARRTHRHGEDPKDELDLVNNPPHYQSGGIEAIDVIEAFELPYHIGSAVKYLLRAGRKDNRLMDLEKAAWYIDREIEREKETRDHD